MKFGLSIKGKQNGACYCRLLGKVFDFVIFDTREIHDTIKHLCNLSGRGTKVARLCKGNVYTFDSKPKNLEAAFALLYDFVDYFVIAAFDDPSEDIDPLVNLRLYNEDFKPIFLELSDNMMFDDLDEVIAYSKLSNIDGLVTSSTRLAEYASHKTDGLLSIVMLGVNDENGIQDAIKCGAGAVAMHSGRFPFLKWFSGRRLRNKIIL